MAGQEVKAAQVPIILGTLHVRGILLLLALLLLLKIVWFSNLGQSAAPRSLVDFDAFYIVAEMVWRGEIAQAYSFTTLGAVQKAVSGKDTFMPWTYPPPFNLIVAPLALLPLIAAYALFTGGTLIAYLAILKRVAGEHFALALIVLFPCLCIMIACGQNGFLTGALIGLTCLGLQKRLALTGLPLGLMIIKPHLAVGFALYTIATRRWGAVLVAAATIAATSAIATILLGPAVWTAFLKGVKEAQVFLEHGLYPLYRMISPYAALRTFGLPAGIAFTAQIVAAALSLGLIGHAVWHGLPLRQTLGLTAIASLLISPYAYDYDLPIYGIGFALLMPDIVRLGSPLERRVLYGLTFVMSFFGLAQSFRLEVLLGSGVTAREDMPLSAAGLILTAILGMTWRILMRDRYRHVGIVDDCLELRKTPL